MKLNKLKLTRTTLRLGLGLTLMGFTVFLAIFALQLSPIQAPVMLWETIMQIGFFSGTLGVLMLLTTALTFIPGAARLSSKHLQTHGHTYSSIFSAIGVGLVGLFSAAVTLAKMHGPAVAEMMDVDYDDIEVNSGSPYVTGSDEWYIDYIHDEH